MSLQTWLRDPRWENERRQAAWLGAVVALVLAIVVALGISKQQQMEREAQPDGPGAEAPGAAISP